MNEELDVKKILEFLPHRYPFLLVDRILEVVTGPEGYIKGLKNVTFNEPFFQGHFPGEPVMPGVLILEAMGQAGGVLAFMESPDRKPGDLIYFTGLDKVRFRRPVVPGDQLILTLSILRRRKTILKMKGMAHVGDALAAEAELMAMWGE